MSKASLLADKEFEWFLSGVGEWLPEAVEDALRAGASVLAAEMKSNLRSEIVDRQAVQLVNTFGITPVGQDKNRIWNVHLGFDGYQWRRPTHFARRAVQAKRKAAEEAMKNAAEAAVHKASERKSTGG